MPEVKEIYTHLLMIDGNTRPLPGESGDGKLTLEEIWATMGTKFIEPFTKDEWIYILNENARLESILPPKNHAASHQLGQEILGPVIKIRLKDMK